MKLIDILTLESANEGAIHLYKEGVFWKAYQQSAYLFHTQVYAYQVKLKHVKCVAKTVASIGFPDSSLQHLFEAAALQKIDEKRLVVSGYGFEQS